MIPAQVGLVADPGIESESGAREAVLSELRQVKDGMPNTRMPLHVDGNAEFMRHVKSGLGNGLRSEHFLRRCDPASARRLPSCPSNVQRGSCYWNSRGLRFRLDWPRPSGTLNYNLPTEKDLVFVREEEKG